MSNSCDWEPSNDSALYLEVKRRVIELSITYKMFPSRMEGLTLKEIRALDDKIIRITIEFINLLNTGKCVRIMYDHNLNSMVASIL